MIDLVTVEEIKSKGRQLGFDLIGITSADPFTKFEKAVVDGISNGRLPPNMVPYERPLREHEVISDPRRQLKEARSVIVVGRRYLVDGKHDPGTTSRPRGFVSRMYWKDFIAELYRKRDELANWLSENGVKVVQKTVLPTKAAAYRSGVGVYGKNTIIQNEDLGSWVLYAGIITDAKLPVDEQLEPRCGACQKCIRLCPAKAIPEPYVLNASRCLNHFLASADPIPLEFREAIGDRINSCDTCQEVCPRNENVSPIRSDLPDPWDRWTKDPDLIDVLHMGLNDFDRYFAILDWYIPELLTLKRNALVALGNVGDLSTLPEVDRFLEHENESMREHARWAHDRIIERSKE